MTKRKLGEQLIKTLNAGSNNSDVKITMPQAMLYVGQARNVMIKELLYSNYANFGEFDVPHDFLSEFIVTPVENEYGQVMSSLPAHPIGGIHQDMGIYHVSYPNDEPNAFAPLKSGWSAMYAGMASQNLEGRSGYYPQGDKIYFTEDVSGDVLIRMIADSADIGERDFFPITPDMESEVLGRAVSIAQIAMQTPEDNQNDNEAIRVG
jgi:hypothetical protein